MSDITMNEFLVQHCSQSMKQALATARHIPWKRECSELSDTEFVQLGLLRCITSVDSGRHFIQNTLEVHNDSCCHSTYFNSLHSIRRTEMLKDVSRSSYALLCNEAKEMGVDYLKDYPDLDGYDVEAADGHFITHACHTPRNQDGRVFAAGFVYAMNMRNGFINPVCKVTNGTNKSHEIPYFKEWVEKVINKGMKLYIYDRAAVDYEWWDKQKKHAVYMVSILKENAIIDFVEALDYDRDDLANVGIQAYEVYRKGNRKFTVVRYVDPETGNEFKFISTLPSSVRPGTIAMLYYKRWTIEKAFNNTKSDLNEKKAWSSDMNTLDTQMRLTAMSYNLIRLLEEKTKKESPGMIHSAEAKYRNRLIKRDEDAKLKGRFVNPLHFGERIARICSSTIRAVQNAILTNISFSELMERLMTKFILRPILI